jgi:hypothetical protein
MSSQNLQPRTKIKFCAKLGRSASEPGAVLAEAHGTEGYNERGVSYMLPTVSA